MLVMQRPTVEPITEEEGNRQRFALGPSIPASVTPSATRCGAPSCRPSPARPSRRCGSTARCTSSTPSRAWSRTSPTSSSTSRTSCSSATATSRHPAPRRAPAGRHHRPRHPAHLGHRDPQRGPPPGHAEQVGPHRGRHHRVQGPGYRSAEANKTSETIGVIPVDSIFSPVRRVSFDVEPTRVEQSTEFDRLVLDIETDGSINPRDALASAGDTLRCWSRWWPT